MDRFLPFRLVAAVAILLGIAVPRGRAEDRCMAAEGYAGEPSALPHAAGALKPGGTLSVLAIGSATVFNPAESLQPGTVTGSALGLSGARPNPTAAPAVTETAFPLRMARNLEALYPGTTVTVTVRGGRGMEAADMLDILHTELTGNRYQLVIWQTGTVEAVRNVPPGDFYQTLSDGAAAIADAGADLVLVDPQFSRFLHANADLDPYNQVLQQIAAQPDTVLFHRFDLMRNWVSEGQIDLERTPRGQRLGAVEMLHICLGNALAGLIAASTKLAS